MELKFTEEISHWGGTGAYFCTLFFVRMLAKCLEACTPPPPPTSHFKMAAHILFEISFGINSAVYNNSSMLLRFCISVDIVDEKILKRVNLVVSFLRLVKLRTHIHCSVIPPFWIGFTRVNASRQLPEKSCGLWVYEHQRCRQLVLPLPSVSSSFGAPTVRINIA